jgi:lysophospholipase L1-like esterase
MEGVDGKARFLTNSLGIRGEELTNRHKHRIMVMGGSATESTYLDHVETWPYLIQEYLRKHRGNKDFWVGNIGVSGITTRHHLLQMKYALTEDLEIDTVIALIGGNDMLVRIRKDTRYNPDFMEVPDVESQLLEKTFKIYPGKYTSLYYRSVLFRRLSNLYHIYFPEKYSGVYINKRSDGSWYEPLRKRRRSHVKTDYMPDLATGLQEYRENIIRMIDIAREKNLRIIFVTQPTLHYKDLSSDLENMLLMGIIKDENSKYYKMFISAGRLAEAMREYNDVLLRTCKKEAVECIDLASSLPKDTTIFYDDIHFNESGSRTVAAIVARYLISVPMALSH